MNDNRKSIFEGGIYSIPGMFTMQNISGMLTQAAKYLKAFVITALIVNISAYDETFECTFDLGLCNFTSSVDYSWKRRTGSTPSSPTGPSSDHTTGDGYYMYVEASSPNFPLKGPFELEASLGSVEASSIIFWYSMYGQSMGSLALQTYSTNSGWVEQWSKSGDQGEDWQIAIVAIDTVDTFKVKFVAYTGWDYSGDVAIDDVNITLRMTPSPTQTTSPSNSPSPTAIPSLEPTVAPSRTPSPTLAPSPGQTNAPTTYLTSTASQIQNALEASGNTILVGSDITLSSALVISNVTAVRIFGNAYEVTGGGKMRCFNVLNADILILNLIVSNGFSYGYGGGMYINGYSQVNLLGCSFLQNEAHLVSGGAIFADGAQDPYSDLAESGKYMTVTIRNCNFTGNLGAFGGAIRFNFQMSVTMENCTISENKASSSPSATTGGGVVASNGVNLTMLDCTISHNYAIKEGGGLAFYGANVHMERCLITENRALFGGGLIADSSSYLSCTETSFLYNDAVRGAGAYIGGSLSVLYFDHCNIAHNVASEGSGAGLYISAGIVSIVSSTVFNNTGSGAYFTLKSGAADGCSAIGGCFYSPNYPSDYNAFSACEYETQGNGTLNVITFNTEENYDYLLLNDKKYNGREGPECVDVIDKEIIKFSADIYTESSGFEICFSETSSGGGLYVIGGTVYLNNVTIASNTVSHRGGGLYVDSGNVYLEACVLENNMAASGNEVHFISGEFKASDLSVVGNGVLVEGASAHSGIECSSACKHGTWGNCTLLLGTENCFANCHCDKCPAGATSNAVGATSQSVCTQCGAGQVPDSTGTSCSSCPPGTFTTDSLTDESGGVSRQVALGATSCNACPRGRFAAHSSALVCQRCATGRSSSLGSSNCTLCDANYYAIDSNCYECTARLQCLSTPGRKLPGPQKGYWADLYGINMNSGDTDVPDIDLYECPRATCVGVDPNNSSCWGLSSKRKFLQCVAEEMCLTGSEGPLCGGCQVGYTYSPTDAACSSCATHVRRAAFAVAALVILTVAACLIYFKYITIPERLKKNFVIGSLSKVDTGTLRVAYSTYQITSSIAWTTGFAFPQSFARMLQMLSIFSLDFLNFRCVPNSSAFTTVIAWSIVPIVLEVLCLLLCFIRRARARTRLESKEVLRQHSEFFFVMTYAVMPPICRFQFEALDCIDVAGNKYLRSDTTVDCNSARYAAFKVLDIILILSWMSVPLIWLLILYRKRHRLNPSNAVDMSHALRLQRADKGLNASAFLWMEYQPTYYYWEAVEIYRRVLFVGLVPLVSSVSSRRAAFGLLAAICSAVCFREIEPFRRHTNNVLSHVAQYVIMLNYGAALCISTGVSDNLNPLVFGLILVAVNLIVVGLALYLGAMRYNKEMNSNQWWRRDLNTQEIAVVHAVMQGRTARQSEIVTESAGLDDLGIAMVKTLQSKGPNNAPSLNAEGKDISKNMRMSAEGKVDSFEILQRYLKNVEDVVVTKRVGAGAYGEVFFGTVLGRPVAIKTMLKVTEDNAKAFRAEILLTATLKHPNIVGFVGACWSRELVALLLEWVPKGSLESLLSQTVVNLAWNDPLLRLASDVARGMAYLHSRSYFDELTRTMKNCILHRDLKPDNVLVTEFLSSKISDFGTSRSKAQSYQDVAMTAVGTPLFCAPEVLNGEIYDEKVDVYSFGMVLLAMCVEQPLLEYLSARWCVDFDKKQAPKQTMRLIRKIAEGWRTFTAVPQAPPKLNALLVQCLEVKSEDRLTFEQILSELSGLIKDEIEDGNFDRQPVGSCDDSASLDANDSGVDVEDNSESDGFFDSANPADKTRLRAASLIQQQAGTSEPNEPPVELLPHLTSQGGIDETEANAGAEFMRNPMNSVATRGTDDSRLSQRFSQGGRHSEYGNYRGDLATCTEV